MNAAIWVAIIGALVSVGTFIYKEWSQRQSINTAFLAELQRLRSVLAAHRDWWNHLVESGNTDLPLIPFATPVLDKHEKDLGQVDSQIVAGVVQFYGDIKFLNSLQAERSTFIAKGKSDSFDKQYLGTLNAILERYKGQFENADGCYDRPDQV